jgi:hypothetical protein
MTRSHDRANRNHRQILQLREPGIGLASLEMSARQRQQEWDDTIETADAINWQLDARIKPRPIRLRDDNRIALCSAILRAISSREHQPRLTCPHVIDEVVPSVLLATATPVEVCMNNRCLVALTSECDTAQFYGEYCSMCGLLDTPARLETICLPSLVGLVILPVCQCHFETSRKQA